MRSATDRACRPPSTQRLLPRYRRRVLAFIQAAGLIAVAGIAHAAPEPRSAPAPGAPTSAPKASKGSEAEPAAEGPPSVDDYHFEPDLDCPFCELMPGYPNIRRGLHWHQHWRNVGVMEYVSTPLLFAAAGAVQLGVPESTRARWSSPILFDEAARDGLVFGTADGRRRSRIASDVLFFASVVHPVVIDNLLVTWLGRQSPEVAWQLFVINAQAYALTLAVNAGVKRLAGRERPWGDTCEAGSDEHDCDSSERYRSFYSGHASVTATGAGLMCAHHTQLELYKNPGADTAACLGAVAFTAATGVLRMTSDNHWASDVLIGHFMGYLSGYLMPTLLYYKEFRITPEGDHGPEDEPPERPGPTFAVFPAAGPGSFQLSAVGFF